jgi:hypothetical protein
MIERQAAVEHGHFHARRADAQPPGQRHIDRAEVLLARPIQGVRRHGGSVDPIVQLGVLDFPRPPQASCHLRLAAGRNTQYPGPRSLDLPKRLEPLAPDERRYGA